MHHSPNLNFFPRPAVSVVLLVFTTATAVAPTFSYRCDGCGRVCVRVSGRMSCSDGCDRGRLAHLCGWHSHAYASTDIPSPCTTSHTNTFDDHRVQLTHNHTHTQSILYGSTLLARVTRTQVKQSHVYYRWQHRADPRHDSNGLGRLGRRHLCRRRSVIMIGTALCMPCDFAKVQRCMACSHDTHRRTAKQ
jgi:hypothetical protein